METYLEWIELHKEVQEQGFNHFNFLFYWQFHILVIVLFFFIIFILTKTIKNIKLLLSISSVFFLLFCFLYYNKENYLVSQLETYHYILPSRFFNETNLLSKISLNHSKGLKLIAQNDFLYFELSESNIKRLKDWTDDWKVYHNNIYKVPVNILN